MLEQLFANKAAAERLKATQFESHLESFAVRVSQLGYSQPTVRTQLRLIASLDRWLRQHVLDVGDLRADVADAFFCKCCGKSGVRRGDAQTLRLFLDHLRGKGVIPPAEPQVDESSLGKLRTRYEEYLRRQRGLSPVTGSRYWPFISRLLMGRFGDGPIGLRDLRPPDITRFLLGQVPCRTPKAAQLMVTALRSFFRFLVQHGETECDLSAAVLRVSSWRLAEVPKYLKASDIESILQCCDQTSPAGRRNYAILLLLARLGLRAGEVVRMELDDLDWRAGEFTVRGKGLLHDRLPLPHDVGTALAAYLRQDRPACATRKVFVRTKAPYRGFNHASTVSTIVRRAVERAGLTPPMKGAHLLRHSLATDLLRHGASMAEIGELLRHRIPSTTEIYAKVDVNGLRALARRWPQKGGGR